MITHTHITSPLYKKPGRRGKAWGKDKPIQLSKNTQKHSKNIKLFKNIKRREQEDSTEGDSEISFSLILIVMR